MNKKKSFVTGVLILALLLCPACGGKSNLKTTDVSSETSAGTSEQMTRTETAESEKQDPTLCIGCSNIDGCFSPFLAKSKGDQEVMSLLTTHLLTVDRSGAVVLRAAEGETISYDGTDYTYQGIADVSVAYDETTDTTTYTWEIRDDLYFGDGERLTADDILFTYYVFLDPSFPEPTALQEVPILGVRDYRRQIKGEVYARYDELFYLIYKAGENHTWSEKDSWTEEQQVFFWENMKKAWVEDIEAIINHVTEHYLGYAKQYTGFDPLEIDNEGRAVVLAMTIWGFGQVQDGILTAPYSQKTWNLTENEYPTAEDFYEETHLCYEGNPEAYWGIEGVDETPVLDSAREQFISTLASEDEDMAGGGVPQISGIKKESETKVSITVSGYDPEAIYNLDIPVAPLHYYGDLSWFNGEDKFGFPFGDLSSVLNKTDQPVGAGPYCFLAYQDDCVLMKANDHYFAEKPFFTTLQMKETNANDQTADILSGLMDVFVANQLTNIEESGQDLSENNKISIKPIDDAAYSYIGINAATVRVAGDSSSEESIFLRKGLATVLALCRDMAAAEEWAMEPVVIHYPVPRMSFVSPSPDDEGYQTSFSTGIDGKNLYSEQMTENEKEEAARKAAVEYLVKAGYETDENGEVLTKAPEGASLSYSLLIQNSQAENKLTTSLLNRAVRSFSQIGIKLEIIKVDSADEFWNTLASRKQNLWYAEREQSRVVDLYEGYHSDRINKKDQTQNTNYFSIKDDELDELILDLAEYMEKDKLRSCYKACFDIVMDWAVEVPLFQKQNFAVIRTEKVDPNSIPDHLSAYHHLLDEICRLKPK